MKVKDVFHSFLGEGPHTGEPALFIRLAGCNLSCPFCDERGGGLDLLELVGAEKIEAFVDRWFGLFPRGYVRWVVVTGGEPTIHDDLSLLLKAVLTRTNLYLETNGTGDWQALFGLECYLDTRNIVVVVSPKNPDTLSSLRNSPSFASFCGLVETHLKLVYPGLPEETLDPLAGMDRRRDLASAEVNRILSQNPDSLFYQGGTIVTSPHSIGVHGEGRGLGPTLDNIQTNTMLQGIWFQPQWHRKAKVRRILTEATRDAAMKYGVYLSYPVGLSLQLHKYAQIS